jgi:serine/threonine protein kinase
VSSKDATTSLAVKYDPDQGAKGLGVTQASTQQISQRCGAYAEGDLVADKYRLLQLLGEGGMGAVWVARNEALTNLVALKLIRSELASGEMADRLLREARAAAQLEHHSIVRVFDYGKTALNDPFIVMELLEGEDISKIIQRRGKIKSVKAVRTLLPIMDAVEKAHERGIVHRDIKPDNIFLSRKQDGIIVPKLVDFGIAKLDRGSFERITQFGTVIGSPAYLSPEQARGLEVDHRTDIWSLAIVLFEMISGTLPFPGPSYPALIKAIVDDPAPSLFEQKLCDRKLQAIIDKALEKQRDNRWNSAREFGLELAQWLVANHVSEDISGMPIQSAWFRDRKLDGASLFDSVAPTPSQAAMALEETISVAHPPVLRGVDSDLFADLPTATQKHSSPIESNAYPETTRDPLNQRFGSQAASSAYSGDITLDRDQVSPLHISKTSHVRPRAPSLAISTERESLLETMQRQGVFRYFAYALVVILVIGGLIHGYRLLQEHHLLDGLM